MNINDFINFFKVKNLNDTSIDFSRRIKILVELAPKHDTKCYIHGARTYKYQFNHVAKIKDVRDFEKRHHIKIPEPFFKYLTEVGNGGAGVDYGIYSLEKMETNNKHLLHNVDTPVLFDYKNINEEWKNLSLKLENLENGVIKVSDEEFNNIYNEIISKMFKGLLVIGTSGCTYDYVLICDGKYTGQIGMIDWNLEDYSCPILFNKDFETWICSHFNKIINEDITKHGKGFWTVNK